MLDGQQGKEYSKPREGEGREVALPQREGRGRESKGETALDRVTKAGQGPSQCTAKKREEYGGDWRDVDWLGLLHMFVYSIKQVKLLSLNPQSY
jgi:hypothetical protein